MRWSGTLNNYPLHLIKAHLIAAPVVELRRAGAGMVRHFGGFFKCPAVFQVCRNTGRPERVIADFRLDPRRYRAAADHLIGVCLGQGGYCELPGAPAYGAE